MFVEHMRRAIAAAPRQRLAELSGAVWKAFAGGALNDDEAQGLAELIEARKVVPVNRPAVKRTGSRPRSDTSMERRRRWVASGLMPPAIAARFTMGEGAALAVIAAEVASKGACKLTVGHIAALAGVGRSTVKNAVRVAVRLGLLRSEEWRLSAWRSAPNTVTIISAEWSVWLRLVRKKGRGQIIDHHVYKQIIPRRFERSDTRSISGGEAARSRPNTPVAGGQTHADRAS